MQLKKAIEKRVNYPSKESLRPFVWSVGVAVVLSACTPPKQPQEPQTTNRAKSEVEHPAEVAGGIPAFIPPPKNDGSQEDISKKDSSQ